MLPCDIEKGRSTSKKRVGQLPQREPNDTACVTDGTGLPTSPYCLYRLAYLVPLQMCRGACKLWLGAYITRSGACCIECFLARSCRTSSLQNQPSEPIIFTLQISMWYGHTQHIHLRMTTIMLNSCNGCRFYGTQSPHRYGLGKCTRGCNLFVANVTSVTIGTFCSNPPEPHTCGM